MSYTHSEGIYRAKAEIMKSIRREMSKQSAVAIVAVELDIADILADLVREVSLAPKVGVGR